MKQTCVTAARGERAWCTAIRSPFDQEPACTETQCVPIPSPVG